MYKPRLNGNEDIVLRYQEWYEKHKDMLEANDYAEHTRLAKKWLALCLKHMTIMDYDGRNVFIILNQMDYGDYKTLKELISVL